MKNQNTLLVLTVATILFTLMACQSPADPLDGTSWNLVSLNGESPISENTPTASFEDGQVGGSSGCNSYGGKYEVDGDKIAISEVASTLMACIEPEGVMEQESQFLGALSNAQTFRLVDGQLEILASDGTTLIFTRQGTARENQPSSSSTTALSPCEIGWSGYLSAKMPEEASIIISSECGSTAATLTL